MGSVFYGAMRTRIDIDDVLLMHVQSVALAKLRRGESFAITWVDSAKIGDGRSCVWMSPGIEIHFKYAGSKPPKPDPELLEKLMAQANSAHGLLLNDATLAEPAR